jgi:hypothetical protein
MWISWFDPFDEAHTADADDSRQRRPKCFILPALRPMPAVQGSDTLVAWPSNFA